MVSKALFELCHPGYKACLLKRGLFLFLACVVNKHTSSLGQLIDPRLRKADVTFIAFGGIWLLFGDSGLRVVCFDWGSDRKIGRMGRFLVVDGWGTRSIV